MSKHYSISLLPNSSKQIAFVAGKLTIVVCAVFFIYKKLIYNDSLDFKFFIKQLEEYKILSVGTIISLLILSSINWFLESLKWHELVNHVQKISFLKAFEQSFGALTASIITPNRIGEYGAKAIYFHKKHRKQILGLTFIGNLAQLSVTLIFGVIGLLYIATKFKLPVSSYKILSIGVFILGVSYITYRFFSKKKFKISGYSLKKLTHFLKKIKGKTICQTICLSTLRYVCFSHQFYFLIWLFAVDVTYIEALALISSMYLLTSIIPTIFVLDVLVKGSVAVWLFSFVNANELIILSCVLLMWIFNFATPSIIGSYFVLNFKLPTTE